MSNNNFIYPQFDHMKPIISDIKVLKKLPKGLKNKSKRRRNQIIILI